MLHLNWKQYIFDYKERLLVLFVALQVVSAIFIVPVAATSTAEESNNACNLVELMDWIDPGNSIQIISVSSSENTIANKSSQDTDGLSSDKERQLGTDPNNIDTDCDGISDDEETNGGQPVDTDQDGKIDALDSDSDNDGISDEAETDEDCEVDGIPNYRDSDSDGDGRTDTAERANGTDSLERDRPVDNITDPNNISGHDPAESPTNGSNTGKDDGSNHSSGENASGGKEDNNGEDGGHTSTTTDENPTNTPTTTSVTSSSKTSRTHTEITETNTQSSTGTTSSTATGTIMKTSQRTSSPDILSVDTLPDINSPFIALIGLLCALGGLIAFHRHGS
ncbi:MSCRAMM family adhesin SdrC [Haladaptatus salinisoli]|uniref:MSCRAMM family adhesin SdrC n=1 Tax=Haladaptatus salinisoli TaxID=2884876 RepID=UPI001D0ACF29|nr:MSCRAMM family adhesin SdrC [Haladaptatus salinisoli]